MSLKPGVTRNLGLIMIPPMLVLFPIPPPKRSTSRSRPPIFIPHLSYPISRLDFKPHPPSRQTLRGWTLRLCKVDSNRKCPKEFRPRLVYSRDFRTHGSKGKGEDLTYVRPSDFAQSTQTENVPKSSVPYSSTVGTSGTRAVRGRVRMVLLYLCSIGVGRPKAFRFVRVL